MGQVGEEGRERRKGKRMEQGRRDKDVAKGLGDGNQRLIQN